VINLLISFPFLRLFLFIFNQLKNNYGTLQPLLRIRITKMRIHIESDFSLDADPVPYQSAATLASNLHGSIVSFQGRTFMAPL
jgi:hypothetical protein